jgi:iron(III) transport system permease protein
VVAGDWAERRRPERATSPLVRWTLGAVAWTVAAALVLLWVLVPLGSLGHWTWPALAPALGRSVLLGLGAAVAGTALALAAARRVEGPGAAAGRAIDALARVPAAVPGIAAGAGYLLVFGPMTGAGAGTLLLLVLVVAAWELPTTVRAARAALADADPALARAAASLGARGPVVLGRIVVPTLRPVAGWLFARLFAAGALATGTVIVLAGAGPDLGAVAVLTLAAAGATGAACAVATALLAVAGGAFLLGRAITGRRHGRTLPA